MSDDVPTPDDTERPATPRKGRPRRPEAREVVAIALASGATVAAAAEAVKIAPKTLRTWLAESGPDSLTARVAALRAEALTSAVSTLTANMTGAAGTLVKLLDSADEHVRHKSSVKVLELGLKIREQLELQEQVQDLLKRVDALSAGKSEPRRPMSSFYPDEERE